MAFPLDGHFSTRKGSVRLLFNLPKKGACGNKNSIHGPMNAKNSYPLNSLLGAAGKRFLQHAPFAAAPTGEGQCRGVSPRALGPPQPPPHVWEGIAGTTQAVRRGARLKDTAHRAGVRGQHRMGEEGRHWCAG